MAHSVVVELELPNDWRSFRLPPALDRRLQDLLDRLDRDGKLPPREKREAKALAQLVDMLSLLKAKTTFEKTRGR